MRNRSVIALAALAALVAGCVPAVSPSGSDTPAAPLGGTNWVLESGTNPSNADQPAPSPAPSSSTLGSDQQGVTATGAPPPIQVGWLLPERGSRPTLAFSTDRDAVSGSTGCNRYFGEFSAGPGRLVLESLATTQMMCFDALAVQEITYLEILSKVTGYANTGATLTLTTRDGQQLVFTPLSLSPGTQAATYRYVCDDGLYFTASFDPEAQSVSIQLSAAGADTLQQEGTGATVTYASAQHRLQAKGNEALLDTLADGGTHRCVAPLSPQG